MDGRRTSLELGSDIAARLLKFAVAVMGTAAQLPRERAGRHVASQVIRSSTAGGANYEEARAAESRDDFIHKVRIAAKEVRESIYWLQLIAGSKWTTDDLTPLVREASELTAILVASARTASGKR